MQATETILVVEDEADLTHIFQRALSRHGYTVVTAGSGEEALQTAQAHGGRIDLLISDIVMPGMGGRELVWRMREIFPHISVILLSGYADEQSALEMMDDGAAVFIEKPVDLTVLEKIVRETLDRAR